MNCNVVVIFIFLINEMRQSFECRAISVLSSISIRYIGFCDKPSKSADFTRAWLTEK